MKEEVKIIFKDRQQNYIKIIRLKKVLDKKKTFFELVLPLVELYINTIYNMSVR